MDHPKKVFMYDKKIAIVIINDLLPWQKLNVVAFLASAIGLEFPETHGRKFVNASGSEYLPFLKHPVLIYQAEDAGQMKRAWRRAKERELNIGVYIRPFFATKNEEGNLLEISKVTDEDQDLVGIVLYGENKKVDKAVDGLKYHP